MTAADLFKLATSGLIVLGLIALKGWASDWQPMGAFECLLTLGALLVIAVCLICAPWVLL